MNAFTNFLARNRRAETQQVLDRLDVVEGLLRTLIAEVKTMSDSNTSPLDKAVAGLGAAVDGKLAEDATLKADAQAGLNESADVAQVQALTDKLNAETAAEHALTDPPATPAPTPAPTPVPTPAPAPVNVTVTGSTAGGTPVVEAPVSTEPGAPTTQQVDSNAPNPIQS